MIKLLRRRGVAAVAGLFIAAAGSQASAAPIAGIAPILSMSAASTLSAAPAAKPATQRTSGPAYRLANSIPARVPMAAAAVATLTGGSVHTQAASGLSAAYLPAMAREAAWLYRSGWPLYALVDRYSASATVPLPEQAHCIAVAVYHEARGESLEGQLAVARVIMNRAASGRYPGTWCETVKQPWQFSFVNPRTGRFPYTNTNSEAWRKAVAVTRLAITNVVPSVPRDVLWYHADYVSPSWGRRLDRVDKIGAHIFYRS